MKYKLVRVASDVHSVHSIEHGETFHPVIGPAAEAEALYVTQLRMRQRLERHTGDFVIWDVGLGAAANALTVLRKTQDIPASIKMFSFEHTLDPLRFAIEQANALEYPVGYEEPMRSLLEDHGVSFQNEKQSVEWKVVLGDFPKLIAGSVSIPAPHAVLFDPFSPAKNPAMWTPQLFTSLFNCLRADRPCALATYSRSTFIRVSLLLAGFYVGAGHPTGEKEETTSAANTMDLLDEPLTKSWLDRVRRSGSAEPMWNGVYQQASISADTWEKLLRHPQFQ